MSEQFYTADEARKVLKMTKTLFYKEADSGAIPWIIDPDRKRGRKFPKVAVDTLAKMHAVASTPKLEFGNATINDIWQGYENTLHIYGPDEIVSFQRLLEWRQINPDIFITVREGQKRRGGVTMIPLEEEVIHAIFQGKMSEQDIPDKAIKSWDDPQLSVYIPNISIEPASRKEARRVGSFLVRQAIRHALKLNKKHDIKNWYAYAATPEGKRLLDGLGFQPLEGVRLAYTATDISQSTEVVREILRKLEDDDIDDLMPNHE